MRGDVIAQHGIAADPFAFAPRGAHLVARALRDHLPLELGKREQDVQRQAAHGTGGVELLRHRHKRRAVLVEDLHDPREVEQGPRQPVHLVDHHAVHGAGLDIGQQPLQRRAVHVGAGVAAVVVLLRQAPPSLPGAGC